ncbi:MAG: YHS domain-containing (seleno)protein [Hellea sp.]
MKKLITLSSIALMTISAQSAAFAADEYNTAPGLTAAGAPLALQGVDPVAFLDLGNRIDGAAKYTAVHDGVAYYFDSKDNLKTFKKAPSQYVAQHGGFCTFGVSVGKKFDGDPQFASIVDGKLYLFLNEEIFRMYQKDQSGTISKAEKNWTKIQHTSATDL